jgi:polar amino acid transport system substrate-binding protein
MIKRVAKFMRKKIVWVGSFFLLSVFLFFYGCSSEKKVCRVGIDVHWYPMDFGQMEPNVYGFIQELLVEISKKVPVNFELVNANWDSLLEGMQEQYKRYDVVLGSLKPYNFNENLYDFSSVFLQTGTVLVLPKNSIYHSLEEMGKKSVGVVSGESSVFVAQKQGNIIIKNYENLPESLNALVEDQVDGVLSGRIMALCYVKHLFFNTLQMTKPLQNEGLRMIVLKKDKHIIEWFERGFSWLEKENKIHELLVKWELDL